MRAIKSSQDAEELFLYAVNTSELYHGIVQSIIKNLKQKVRKGAYDKELAVQAWQYAADAAAKMYDKELGSGRGSLTMFSKADRTECAKRMRDYYEDHVMEGENVNSSRLWSSPAKGSGVKKAKPSRSEVEEGLKKRLNKAKVHMDDDAFGETVDYILTMFDEVEYPPADVAEAVGEWFADTKEHFPEDLKKGAIGAAYTRWIKSKRMIMSSVQKRLAYEVSRKAAVKSDLDKVVMSSRESTEFAYDACEFCNNGLKPMYNKWYINDANYEYDYAWFVAEHTDYSVRLYIQFMNTGFVYIDGTFTNGSSYDKKTITSWRYETEPHDITLDRIKDVLDSFFDQGINALRGE